jgi:hypothetical protein
LTNPQLRSPAGVSTRLRIVLPLPIGAAARMMVLPEPTISTPPWSLIVERVP